MTRHLAPILFLFSLPAFAQVKNCFCEKDLHMNGATVSCDTTTFKNNSKLYWQYNCDRIWLTLENIDGQKIVLDEVPVELYGYTYRLGFHLIKEFDKTILFRSGCPANGPCVYKLIDKSTGSKTDEFGQLICIDTDVKWRQSYKYNFDFIVYLSNSADHIIIHYVDNNQKFSVPFKEELTGIIPQLQFANMVLENNILTLFFELDKDTKRTFKIELNNAKYSR